jgi:hypothetical protein
VVIVRKRYCPILLLLFLSPFTLAIDVPLENYTYNSTDGNTTTYVYFSEEVDVTPFEEDTFLFNVPVINNSEQLGHFKWKSIQRLLYLNETSFGEDVYFIIVLRKKLNESELTDIASTYNVTLDIAAYKSTIGGGETPWPPDNDALSDLEIDVAEFQETYNNLTNFTLVEGYVAAKAHGSIFDVLDLLYDNATYNIDPGPHDLNNEFDNSSSTPTTHIYSEYSNLTSCNDSLRTSSNDVDGDLFAVCEGDCNDNNADVHPGASELWDGVDNDCDGEVDEGVVNCVGVQPNYAGDWNVSVNTTCNETEVTLSSGADVIINENIELFLDNTTLYLDQSPGDDAVIWLDGILKLLDSITDWLT